MDELLKEVAKQVPNLGILAAIVWMFLSHLKSRDIDYNKNMLEISSKSDKIVEENTASNKAVIEVLVAFKKDHK